VRKILDGVRVLDLTRVLAGPWATQNLADFGAEVIKVERPGHGDDTRKWGPPFLCDREGRETADAAYYLACNRGKKSVTLDLKHAEAQEIVRKLAGDADNLVARALARRAVRESLVLLKNDNNLLPLTKGRKVLVTGPAADSLMSLNNGWSYVWQGDRANLYPKDRPTILSALRAKLGESNVAYVPGAALEKEINITEAVNAARDADIAVVCLGEGAYAETPGNLTRSPRV